MKKRLRVAATGVGLATMVAVTGVATSSQAQADGRRVIPNTTPGWVSETPTQGAAPDHGASHFKVYLQPHGGLDAMKAAVSGVSNPDSAQYGEYLTSKQFHAQYDPTSADVKLVSAFLATQNLTVASTDAHRRSLDVTGTNADVEQAFNTTIATFQHDGQTVQSNTSALTLPASVAPLVLTVTGLDTTTHLVTHQEPTPAPPPTGFNNGRPCSASYGQLPATYQADYKTPLPKFQGKTLPYSVCGYTGPQLRSAYQGSNPRGLDGTGVTIAVLDAYAAPTIKSDATTYAVSHGDGSYAAGQFKQVTPATYTHEDECDPSGWFGEETLDIEAEHAMAPGANIRYYGAQSCFDEDFLAALGTIVDQNKVALVSNSWDGFEADENPSQVAAYEQVFMQGALQGISFTFSSGDNGDEVANTGLKQVDYPSSDPYVTSIGGTADAIGPAGSFLFQTGWGTQKYSLNAAGSAWSPVGYLYGSGGGSSSLFNRPSYQNGVVPTGNGPGRAVPDVAMDADPTTGMLVGETQTFTDGVRYGEYRIGGTSLASPLFAGQTALLMQRNGGVRLGLLNPLVYGKMRTSGRFADIQGTPADAGNVRVDYANGEDATGGLLYSVRTFNQDSSLVTAPGWDNVTGNGAPNPDYINFVLPKKR